MKRLFCMGALAAALALAGSVGAQTLRWASQGDAQTMDPHSQNESSPTSSTGRSTRRWSSRGKKLDIVPALATEWTQVSR